jgi:hypothetical protein
MNLNACFGDWVELSLHSTYNDVLFALRHALAIDVAGWG